MADIRPFGDGFVCLVGKKLFADAAFMEWLQRIDYIKISDHMIVLAHEADAVFFKLKYMNNA